MKHYDVIVVGGGPAGSTVSTLIKHYAPNLRVLLLEKSQFPRHHVGESLLAGATPILEEMGAYEKVNKFGFLEKLGATYIWGHDREPWGFEFNAIVEKLAKQGRKLPDIYTKAWQVKRAEYDHLLLKHAASRDVEVHQQARVLRVNRDAATQRVTGVDYRDERGTHTVSSTWLLDCTGQDALLGRELKLRTYDERMNNYALFGYWKGAKWKYEYLGHPHLTRIFIATTPRGWLWYIPMSRDVVGVGFVTHRQTLKDMPGGPEQLYREEINACPEIQGLLDKAFLTRIARDQARDVCAIQDWSYTSKQIAGPGWAMVGDAAGFVDPILSSGVMLAHEVAQKAAYAVNSSFQSKSDKEIDSYWKFYEDTYHIYLKGYRDMAAFWYSNNFSMESWLWQAQRTLVQADYGVNLNDRESFNRLASGYATRAESLSLFGSYPLHEAQALVDGLFGVPNDFTKLEADYAQRPLRLAPTVKMTDGLYFYQGLVRNTRRVVNVSNKQYLDLHPAEELLVNLLDGQHTLKDINSASEELQSIDPMKRMPVRNGIDLLVQLDNIGALAS